MQLCKKRGKKSLQKTLLKPGDIVNYVVIKNVGYMKICRPEDDYRSMTNLWFSNGKDPGTCMRELRHMARDDFRKHAEDMAMARGFSIEEILPMDFGITAKWAYQVIK